METIKHLKTYNFLNFQRIGKKTAKKKYSNLKENLTLKKKTNQQRQKFKLLSDTL